VRGAGLIAVAGRSGQPWSAEAPHRFCHDGPCRGIAVRWRATEQTQWRSWRTCRSTVAGASTASNLWCLSSRGEGRPPRRGKTGVPPESAVRSPIRTDLWTWDCLPISSSSVFDSFSMPLTAPFPSESSKTPITGKPAQSRNPPDFPERFSLQCLLEHLFS